MKLTPGVLNKILFFLLPYHKLGHRTTVGAHVTMKSGGKGPMNVCYDRYNNKTSMQSKTMTTTSKVKKVVKTKTNKKWNFFLLGVNGNANFKCLLDIFWNALQCVTNIFNVNCFKAFLIQLMFINTCCLHVNKCLSTVIWDFVMLKLSIKSLWLILWYRTQSAIKI